MLGCLPDDDKIESIDPFVKAWCFNNWIQDQNDKVDLAKNHAYIIGSFINPEAVKNMIGDNNTYSTTDEEFEKSTRMVREDAAKNNDAKKSRIRKRKLKSK
jgi:hypothetical protein